MWRHGEEEVGLVEEEMTEYERREERAREIRRAAGRAWEEAMQSFTRAMDREASQRGWGTQEVSSEIRMAIGENAQDEWDDYASEGVEIEPRE